MQQGHHVIKIFASEFPPQYQFLTLREDEIIEKAGCAGCPVEFKLPQGRKSNPFLGRNSG